MTTSEEIQLEKAQMLEHLSSLHTQRPLCIQEWQRVMAYLANMNQTQNFRDIYLLPPPSDKEEIRAILEGLCK